VFVVAHLGAWQRAAAVLFEPESLRGDSAPIEFEEKSDSEINNSNDPIQNESRGFFWNGRGISQTLDAVLYKRQAMPEKNRFPAVQVPAWTQCPNCPEFICGIHNLHAHECDCPRIDQWVENDLFPYLPSVIRYLTPRECERLQGFPDDWTAIPYRGKPASDGPRYKAIGNSMAVPVMKWIGERIAIVDAATKEEV
jgi:DNA (cytosine-5)-methyltransferase 1